MAHYSLLFLTGVAAAEAWTGVSSPAARLGLRTSHRTCGTHAPAMALDTVGGGDARLGRRSLLEFAGQAAIAPAIISALPRSVAAETVDKETADAVAKIPLSVLKVRHSEFPCTSRMSTFGLPERLVALDSPPLIAKE